jgi:signal transduction histidine kinase
VTIRVLGAVSRRGAALAAAVLTLGVATGATASASLAMAREDAASAGLDLRTATVRAALDTTFLRYADTMHDLVAAAISAPATVTDLSDTVTRIAGERLPGACQVLVVGPDRKIIASRPVDGSTPAPAAVLDPEPELARAMELARISGRLVASPAHVLPADLDLPPAHRQRAFELAAPVHDTTFQGWVVVSVRAGDLLDTSLRAAGVTGVGVVLAQSTPDGATRDVATWPAGARARHDRGVDIAPAGHAWQVFVQPTDAAGPGAAPILVLLAAAVLSVLLAGIVLALDSARIRAGHRRNRAVAEAEAANERALRAEQAMHERDAELTGFAAAAGENLHTPLHTIAGFTDLLLEDAAPQLDPASRGFLDRISASTRRMLGLVSELVAYTSAGEAALKPEPVDAERVALDVAVDHLDRADGERPSIDVGDLPLVTADTERLRQVLDQLVGNAVRFVRHGSAARVTVGARELAGGWWRIEVADRGIGVPEEYRERIFAPFHRTPAAEGYPGTGLGLAICRRIVALHGGEIGVDANPGGGSVFWFTVSASGVTLSADDLGALAAA